MAASRRKAAAFVPALAAFPFIIKYSARVSLTQARISFLTAFFGRPVFFFLAVVGCISYGLDGCRCRPRGPPFLRPTGAKNERCSRDFWTDNNTARPKTSEPRMDGKGAGIRTFNPHA